MVSSYSICIKTKFEQLKETEHRKKVPLIEVLQLKSTANSNMHHKHFDKKRKMVVTEGGLPLLSAKLEW